MNDSQLILACKKQDRRAQKELYETYGPKMMGVCLRYTNDTDSARDLLHDGFIQIFTQIGSFSGRGSFEGWLKRIFVNLALNNFRRENQEKKMFDSFTYDQTVDTTGEDDDFFDWTDITRDDLLDMIRELPSGYKAVVNLFIFEEMSHREIGEALGISETASRSQYSRAKALLKKKITAITGKNNPLKKQNER
ncbi:MAG: sigma-70 family RNA polymerase sigma factor [Dysgonamonadaceae bacterium]|jgi:RNA polymerase sigma-70 factor (ECF subfamily)|nr:sigma-70 family RNA polymerase sigma factor [Dysgonamonadaceae bacterium]